jgi:hypothetical protein
VELGGEVSGSQIEQLVDELILLANIIVPVDKRPESSLPSSRNIRRLSRSTRRKHHCVGLDRARSESWSRILRYLRKVAEWFEIDAAPHTLLRQRVQPPSEITRFAMTGGRSEMNSNWRFRFSTT